MKVTFIGVGAIGLPMALQIQRAGHEVTGVDVPTSSLPTPGRAESRRSAAFSMRRRLTWSS